MDNRPIGSTLTLVCTPVLADGATPGAIDGKIGWKSSDESVATVQANDDGFSATVKSTGKAGACTITASADNDLTPVVNTISAGYDLNFVAAADHLLITAE
jgi:hypothetical protein